MRKRRIRTRSGLLNTELPHIGQLSAPVYMVMDPVVGNLGAKTPLSKKQMEWFANHASHSGGFAKEDVCIISAAPPVTAEMWQSGKQTNDHLKEHKDKLLSLIEANKPKFILPFGAKACQQVIGRAVQITKVRGQPIGDPDICGGIPMLPMLSPFFAQRQPQTEAAFKADFNTAGRIYKAGYDLDASAVQHETNYRWCYNLAPLFKKRPKRIAVDIEGTGLIPFEKGAKTLTIQISYKPGEVLCVPIHYDYGNLRHHDFIPWNKIDRPRLLRQVKKLLTDPRIEVVGHNFKFDWMWLHYTMGIDVANYAHDTILLAHLNDENGLMNIDDQVRMHVPEMAGFNDILNLDPDHMGKSRMDLLPPDKMLEYASGDADATLRLLKVLLAKVREDKRLYACYKHVTMPAMSAFCYIEQNGFPVSRSELISFEDKLAAIQKKEKAYLLRSIPKVIRDKHKDTGVGLKPDRNVILVDWLYNHPKGLKLKPRIFTKTGQPSVSSKLALPYYVADHPIVARLIDYIKNEKLLNTYAKGFHKYIFDGLIRPTYKLASTVTGRSASADPNGQNFPKRGKLAKDYRKIFQAPKGWVFLSCDLSQAELRIAAMMSGDPNMLQVYKDGGDIHATTAAGTMGLTLDEFNKLDDDTRGLKRFQAKAVNFGFLYGMWWVKFREYAKTDYGIDFTEKEAKEIRERFFQTYPMLEYWHEDVQELVLRNGFIRTFDGRIRHLPNVHSDDDGIAKQAMRQGINSPVQSIASDLGLMTLGRLMPYLRKSGKDKWLKPCGFIHDAIVCLVRNDKVAEGATLLKHYMENNPTEQWFGWTPEIPILADAEIGRTLAITYELKPAQFVGKKRSYADFLEEEIASLRSKYRKEKDADKKTKLKKALDLALADLEMSNTSVSTTKYGRRIIKRKRSNTTHGTKTHSRIAGKSRRFIRKAA